METKVEIIRRETIKPSCSTPPHLKVFNLSLLDQIAPVMYTSLVLFYLKNSNTDFNIASHNLKKSLSETLARFFPLAGRISSNATIECTDEGAQYFEAKFNGFLSTFLDQHDVDLLRQFFPANLLSPEAATGPLLLVQVTSFECGGFAIGVCMSHKFADAATLSIFMKSWASTSGAAFAPGFDQALVPDYEAASHFPARDLLSVPPAADAELSLEVECITKRYVFDKAKILDLKAKASGATKVENPTRVEVVTALVWECATKAARCNLLDSNAKLHKYSVLAQLVNLRKRVEPPFPENSIGNLVGYFSVIVDFKDEKPELRDLVAKLRRGNWDHIQNIAKKLRGEEGLELIIRWSEEGGELARRDDVNLFVCSSWCSFGFYEIDFGWGKPIWASSPCTSYENMITLMDTKEGDGVEVFLSLSKGNMASFERDPHILALTSSTS